MTTPWSTSTRILLTTSSFTASGGTQQLQVYNTSTIESEAQRAIRPEAVALGAFGVIAALAALLIGLQLVSRQLRANIGQISVMRAVGAGPTITSSDGLLGTVFPIVVGSLISWRHSPSSSLRWLRLDRFAPLSRPASTLTGRSSVSGVLALVLVVGGWAIIIGSQLAPHRLGAHRPVNEGRSRLVQLALASGLPVSGVAGLRFAFESGHGRSTVPARSVIVGAVLALTVVVATLTFGASLNTLISHPNLYGWNFDYAYYSTDGYGPVPTAIVHPLLSRDHTVATTTGAYFGTVQIQGQVVPVLAESAHAAITPPVLTGHRIDGRGQIVLGSATLAQLHEKLGDTVVVQGDGIPKARLVIVGTATLPTIGTVLGVHPTMTTGAVIPTSVVPTALLSQF